MRHPTRQKNPCRGRVEVGRIHQQAVRPEVSHVVERHKDHDQAAHEVNRLKAFRLRRDWAKDDRQAKEAQCKALFVWACGDGQNAVGIKDIENRVQELLDPVKYAQKQEEKAKEAEKKADAAQDAASEKEEEEETTAPENLISTDAARPAAPDWKDVPEGMSAQYNEAMRQAPAEMDMVREQLVAKLAKLPVAAGCSTISDLP